MRIVLLDEPRPLNDAESSVLGALLWPDFPGSPQLRSQMSEAMVVGECDCGCPTIDIRVLRTAQAAVAMNGSLAPFEGRVTPLGEEPVADIVVFVDREGYLSSLEYVSYLETPPSEWPTLNRISVVHVGG